MKTNRKQNVILLILTGLIIVLSAFTSKAQKADSLLYLQTHKGKTITLNDVQTFHESDWLISIDTNKIDDIRADQESVIIFYNDSPVNYAVYIFYIIREDVVISSRFVKIYPAKIEISETNLLTK